MFPLRSSRFGVGREANKKTAATHLTAAREKPIWLFRGEVNRVRRIGAFSWGEPKKLPWDNAIAAELVVCLPANAETRKEVRRLKIGGCCGGDTRPSQRLADCRCGYTSLSATTRRPKNRPASFLGTTPRFSVGATTDPRHGCSVNTAERVGRQFRFTNAPAGRGGLNGWGYCALRTRQQRKPLETRMNPTLNNAARALSESLANKGITMDHLFLGDLPTFAVIAVLKAIHEPTESMIDAAANTPGMKAVNDMVMMQAARGYPLPPEAMQDGKPPLTQAWQAMIDTITEGQG